MAASFTASSCAACSKVAPRPTLICVKCSEGVDVDGEPRPTHYCSALCLNRDQEAHKSDCEKANRRKEVYRAGILLRGTLMQYRHHFYDMKIARVEKRDGVIYLHDGTYNADDPIFFDPPTTTQSPPMSSGDSDAVLVYSACSDVPQYFHKFSKKLFSDVALHVEEVGVRMDVSFCKVQRCFPDGSLVAKHGDHEVLAIDTVDGDTFIIDAAGSQFGQHRAVLTLQAFVQSYCDPMIVVVRPFGHALSTSQSRLQKYLKTPATDARAVILQAYLTQAFHEAIQLWEEENNTGLSELVRGSRKTYIKGMSELLESAFTAMFSAFLSSAKELNGCRIETIFSRLDYTQPMRDITSLTLSRKPEGSTIHQRWVEQRIVAGRALNPERWDAAEGAVLDNGGTVILPCVDDEDEDDGPDMLSMIQAMQDMASRSKFLRAIARDPCPED